MSAERESNLFSRVMITNRIGRYKVLLLIIIKTTLSENDRKMIQSLCILLKNQLHVIQIKILFLFGHNFLEVVAAV